jgi:hypothetical protein
MIQPCGNFNSQLDQTPIRLNGGLWEATTRVEGHLPRVIYLQVYNVYEDRWGQTGISPSARIATRRVASLPNPRTGAAEETEDDDELAGAADWSRCITARSCAPLVELPELEELAGLSACGGCDPPSPPELRVEMRLTELPG